MFFRTEGEKVQPCPGAAVSTLRFFFVNRKDAKCAKGKEGGGQLLRRCCGATPGIRARCAGAESPRLAVFISIVNGYEEHCYLPMTNRIRQVVMI